MQVQSSKAERFNCRDESGKINIYKIYLKSEWNYTNYKTAFKTTKDRLKIDTMQYKFCKIVTKFYINYKINES